MHYERVFHVGNVNGGGFVTTSAVELQVNGESLRERGLTASKERARTELGENRFYRFSLHQADVRELPTFPVAVQLC
jgi:hypothetical protein